MGNLVWLASYPFSGNRWVRGFLYCALRKPETAPSLQDLRKLSLADTDPGFYEQLSGKTIDQLQPQEVHNLRPQVQQQMTQVHPNPVMVETANAFATIGDVPLFSSEYTAASVYIVRNPFAVVQAMSQQAGMDVERAIDSLANANFFPMFSKRSLPAFCGRWGEHVRSWGRPPWQGHLVLRYEDLVANPGESFGNLLNFMNIPLSPEETLRAAELSKPEEGAAPLADLSEQQKQRIIASNEEMMRHFGYLQ